MRPYRIGYTASGVSGPTSREVNNLLHTLRGEHFRHVRNQTGAFVAKTPHFTASQTGTLPISQIFGEEAAAVDHDEAAPDTASTSPSDEDRNLPAWREKALGLLFAHVPLRIESNDASSSSWTEGSDAPKEILPLTVHCLRVLLQYYRGSSFTEDLVPCLPLHIRRQLLRWTAVHAPLTSAKLQALCEEGQVDGELIVVGPYASLPVNYFKDVDTEMMDGLLTPGSSALQNDSDEPMDTDNRTEDAWDATSSIQSDEPPPLHTLALVNTHLPVPTCFTLPPTLTHLALLSLPGLTPIHRLPRLLPLLEVLDLSYNPWLGQPKIVPFSAGDTSLDQRRDGAFHPGIGIGIGGGGPPFGGDMRDWRDGGESSSVSGRRTGENLLERTEWARWSSLKVLGLRECGVGKEILLMVNQGRWVDVEVIGVG